ncbi:uncharacterized protein M437DRAFT_67732 [Aureobasidium melanogenum CBS 110374]|uniref:Uncharacterized protein n=1 Tax=Aureobasidium melanogenum (strain CBS 110374) TaxID=1043003 RepID=A0A074VK92_AURM1|nr:uncharacterized protein M437DRAFT_67732 [Aureobasidium melanogenum CBS 110374]KEQ60958.1 hypothetical protein M437DRAFT_67732 [Aureobasidium melanogenum CBS 110374]
MAANTPPLSWKEHYDQQYNHLVQIRFNKICSERDSAITINKQLRNANSGCWHIIANKQLEIDALHAKVAALHGTNRRLQQDLNTERQTIRNIRDMTGNGSERVTRQNTSPQHNTPTPATKKPREVINTDDLLVSTSKDYPKDDTTTPDDVTADPETGPQVIENDNAEVPQPASKKKRKKWTKVVVENTSAAKRPRREPKPAVQPKAAGVSQAADVSIPKFFVSHMNEIVNEDGEPLSEDIQADFRQQMDELSTKTTCPRGHWRFANRKGKCVKCQLFTKTSLWTIEGPRQYACKTCANSNTFCVFWNEDVSKYQVLPLPPQFAGEGLLRFKAESGKVLSRTPEGKKVWPKI